ncbi:MAG: hypothetical protein ACREAY_11315 [Nitrososphaera sp.]|uniref:hypothetical protein n=1 Tax=Nitrososphaera sp. TaxID=1971748 RepID=UPI003D6E70BD
MTELPLFTITDPKSARLLAAALDSEYGISYITNFGKDGKPSSVEILLDVYNEKDAELMEAYKQ